MRSLDIVQLDFVVTAARALARGAEEDAAVVMPGVADMHLQFEIAKLLVGCEVTDTITVQNGAQRFELRLAVRDVPLGEVGRGFIQWIPGDPGWEFADAQGSEPDRIGQRLEAQVSGTQAVSQFRNGLDVEILNRLAVGPYLQSRPVHQDAEGFHSPLVFDVDFERGDEGENGTHRFGAGFSSTW